MNARPTPLLLCSLVALALAACGAAPAPPSAELPAQAAPPATATARPTAKPKPTKTPADPAATPAPAEATPTAVPQSSDPTSPAPTDAPQPAATAFAGTALVTNGGNVREVPVSGTPLDQVNANETVQLIGKNESSSWYLLETPRHARGWVSTTLLRIEPAVGGAVPIVAATSLGSAAINPDHWITHTIADSQFELPPSWVALPLDDAKLLEEMVGKLEQQNAQLGKLLRQSLDPSQRAMLKLLAINSEGVDKSENATYIVIPRPAGVSIDVLLQQLVGSVSGSNTGTKLVSGDTKHQINGLPAARVVLDISPERDGPPTTQRLVLWYVVSADKIHILAIFGRADDALLALADRIGQSFKTHDSANGAPATGEALQVLNGGNMRREPRVAASNVIGQVCPGDQVALLERAAGGAWVRVRVVVAAPACDPARVPSGAEGWLNASLLGPITQQARAALPPSLPIARLVPFTHAKTGVSGLRPENWTLFETGETFQISSSPEAPDGFIGNVLPPEKSRAILDQIGRNFADGPAPEIRENTMGADGTGTLLVTLTGSAQGSTQPVRYTVYARISQAPGGLLLAMATVPAEMFPQEEALVRQMVDSLTVTASADGTV